MTALATIPELRPYQQDGVDAARAALQQHRSVLYVAPTGAGKTVLFAFIAASAARLATRVCIGVHRRELVGQVSRALTSFGVVHGIIAPGHPATGHGIQVASVQTLVRRDTMPFDLIIFDEAHHCTANTWRRVVQAQDTASIFGVTATPIRMTGAGLGQVFDHMIVGPDIKTLIDQGYLVRPRLFRQASAAIDSAVLRVRYGEYRKDDVEALMTRREIVGHTIEQYRRHLDGRPSIAFCASVAAAELTAEQFRDAGYRAVSVDGSLSTDERDRRLNDFAAGRLNVLTSCDLISEGFDVPGAYGAILLRQTKSLAIYLQQVGRVLRPHPGKNDAIILDQVGNVFRHGLPQTPRTWSLEVGTVDDGTEPAERVRQCPECYLAHDWAPYCPECGHQYVGQPRAEAEQVDGDLVEVSEEEGQALFNLAKQSGKLKDFHTWAKATGRSPGAAYYAYRRRRGSARLEARR